MTAEQALDFARRVRGLGVRRYPRTPETTKEIARQFMKLTTDQGQAVVEIVATWPEWHTDWFTRLITRTCAPSTPQRPVYNPEYSENQNSIVFEILGENSGLLWLEHTTHETIEQASAVPTGSPQYQAAQQATIECLKASGFPPGHCCFEHTFLENATRARLAGQLFGLAVEELRRGKP